MERAWRRFRRQLPWQLFLVTLLGLPFITPLLRWSSVPCTHDGHLHYHRVAAIRHAWENGLFFSRWLPDLAFGYGYPFFNYREPLPLYLTHFLHLTGLPLPAATNLFYILCILGAGWFMFLWVRDIFGARAGLVSAVAYMAAPYLFADAFVRGNQVESAALALMPFLLWVGRRYLLSGRAGWFMAAIGGLAALALSHNISLLLFTPTLLIYLLALAWLHRLPWKPALLRAGLLFVLGLGLTVFYTGPALLEMNEVTLSLSTTTRNNDFRFNFATLAEIFAPVAPEDPALLNPPLLFRLGWVPAGLGLLGLLSGLFNREREQRGHIALMGLATALFLFLALAASRPVWEALPLIEFVQFPWRFVGRAALPLALLAGAPFSASLKLNWRAEWVTAGQRLLFYAALVLLFLEAVPNLYPAYCTEDPFPTILDVYAYEHETGLVGVDPEGSYFPRTVEERPTGSPLEADYAAGRLPLRLDLDALPAGANTEITANGPLESAFRMTSSEPFTATYLAFAFPGWQAEIDGQTVPITPSTPKGLITFPVPAGTHTIQVHWTSTPLRTTLSLLSFLSLIGVIVMATTGFPRSPFRRPPSAVRHPWSPVSDLRSLALLALLLLAAKLLLFDRVETPIRRTAEPAVAVSSGLTSGLTGEELQLAGYNLSRNQVPAGETFDIDLAWETLAPPAGAYQSNLWLAGPDGLTWSEKETYRPRIYEDTPSTLFWQPGQWAWDSREVHVLPGTPPGRYDIVLTLFPLDTLQPLPLVSPEGNLLGPTAVIGQMEVTRPDTAPDGAPTFAPQFPLSATINGLHFLGYNQDRQEAAPGDPLLLTLFWEKGAADPPAGNRVAVTLQNENGETVRTWTLPPVSAAYPPADWAAGERLRGQHALRLPAGLDTGSYRFYLAETPLGVLAVTAPERAFIPPAFAVPVDVSFGDQLALAGYTLDCAPEPAGSCTISLSWEALAEMETSYHIFVHLVDGTGNILAQSDGQPAGWLRPTTGWTAGEYVLDEHIITLPDNLPAGELTLRIGVYDPETGVRLRGPAGEEYITMPLGS